MGFSVSGFPAFRGLAFRLSRDSEGLNSLGCRGIMERPSHDFVAASLRNSISQTSEIGSCTYLGGTYLSLERHQRLLSMDRHAFLPMTYQNREWLTKVGIPYSSGRARYEGP